MATSTESKVVPIKQSLKINRHFTTPGTDPFDTVKWHYITAKAGDFEQKDVEAPTTWSETAVAIVAKLYFATVNGERESSVRTMIERVVMMFTEWGHEEGYFLSDVEKATFHDELTFILLHQIAAFNTPVWLNLGVPGRKQCCSACFLMNVEDTLSGQESITDWWAKDAAIFKMGAGSGINLSKIRGSHERLSTGGIASGPVAYMRPADAGAGTLKSGGAHRRAAKMVQLDIDHPDILDFINCKVREDERMKVLRESGMNLDPSTIEGEKNIAECTTFQNANNSVRISDKFMENLDELFTVKNRVEGSICYPEYDDKPHTNKSVLAQIAEAAWKCADPGVMFDDKINLWHTTPAQGRVETSNPCGEVHINNNSACNLASMNMAKFLDYGDKFKFEDFYQTVDVMIMAMDITCSFSDLPTDELTENTRNFRQLGLGMCNLGAALMLQGIPYDSDEARDWAASTSSLMTARSYRRSAELAEYLGVFAHYPENQFAMKDVIIQHTDSAKRGSEIWEQARAQWNFVVMVYDNEIGPSGFRNSQVTVNAPTGTISFMMDADSTGIEPLYSLVTYKSLAGGGTIEQSPKCYKEALQSFPGSPDYHSKLFKTAAGGNPLSPEAHLKMVAAIQPHISGASSKTINIPNSATVEDIYNIYLEAWKLGVKCVAVYRDGSKATQVLSAKKSDVDKEDIVAQDSPTSGDLIAEDEAFVELENRNSHRKRLPSERQSITHKFNIGDHEGYITAGKYDDGTLGEIFVGGLGKEGSTLRGMVEAFAISISLGLQHGVPLETFADKFTHMRFDPEGATGNPEIMHAKSIPDYIMRWLISRFGDTETCEEFGVMTDEVKTNKTNSLMITDSSFTMTNNSMNGKKDFGQACACGTLMVRTGTCFACPACGTSTGC